MLLQRFFCYSFRAVCLRLQVLNKWLSPAIWKDSNTLQTWKSPPPSQTYALIFQKHHLSVSWCFYLSLFYGLSSGAVFALRKQELRELGLGNDLKYFHSWQCIQSKACSVTTTASSHCAFTPTTLNRNEAL